MLTTAAGTQPELLEITQDSNPEHFNAHLLEFYAPCLAKTTDLNISPQLGLLLHSPKFTDTLTDTFTTGTDGRPAALRVSLKHLKLNYPGSYAKSAAQHFLP